MNCFLVRKNVHKAAQHFFPQSAQSEEALQPCYNPHSGDGPSELRGVLDGKPQVSVVTASVSIADQRKEQQVLIASCLSVFPSPCLWNLCCHLSLSWAF